MKRYEYVTIETKGYIGQTIKGHREVIDRYAADGYRYAGYIPVEAIDGNIFKLDLIFEIDC